MPRVCTLGCTPSLPLILATSAPRPASRHKVELHRISSCPRDDASCHELSSSTTSSPHHQGAYARRHVLAAWGVAAAAVGLERPALAEESSGDAITSAGVDTSITAQVRLMVHALQSSASR